MVTDSIARSVPRYAQIAGSLKGKLQAGQWKVGDTLPSIGDLSVQYEVAPQTIRKAIELLEEKQWLIRKQGIGTVVLSGPNDQYWLPLPTNWESLLSMVRDFVPASKLEEERDAMPRLISGNSQLADSYVAQKRVHNHENQPFCVVNIYIESELFGQSEETFRTSIVLEELAKRDDINFDSLRQTLRVDTADQIEAPLLDLPLSAPVVSVQRVVENFDKVAVYVADVTYRGDAVQLEF